MNQRRGASLLEMMVAISVMGVVLSMIGTVFHRLFQSEQVSARAALLERTTARLADQYRRDVHAARSVHRVQTADEQRPVLELIGATGDASRVVYTGGKDKVRREAVSTDGTTTRESYRLPDCRISFPEPAGDTTEDSEKAPRMITLRIERPHSTSTSVPQVQRPMHALTIDAELGRDDHLSGVTSIPRRFDRPIGAARVRVPVDSGAAQAPKEVP
jgi:prepilin-type N-terminal cleavage/methylation domain-containing protein